MPLYEIVKADGTREKVEADWHEIWDGTLSFVIDKMDVDELDHAPGTWLEVWRREGVGE